MAIGPANIIVRAPPPRLRRGRLCCALLLALLPLSPPPTSGEVPGDGTAPARRVVSLNPSLTAILLALGAAETLVGVDDFSARQQSIVAHLPRVGGLFNPSLEAMVELRPDLVVLVPGVEQRNLRERLEVLNIPVESFGNIRFDQVLENIVRLGRLVGRQEAAARRTLAIRRTREAVERVARLRWGRRRPPRTLLVLQRDPIFVVGRGSFLDEMLDVVGVQNLADRFDEPYPRVDIEWIVAAGPEILIDVSPDEWEAREFWSRWPSLPAVAHDRVLRLDPDLLILPGPYLDRALEMLAASVHGSDFLPEGRGEGEGRKEGAVQPVGGAAGALD